MGIPSFGGRSQHTGFFEVVSKLGYRLTRAPTFSEDGGVRAMSWGTRMEAYNFTEKKIGEDVEKLAMLIPPLDGKDVLVPLANGGLEVYRRLKPYLRKNGLGGPLEDVLHLSRYQSDGPPLDVPKVIRDVDPENIRGRHVRLIEDLSDHNVTAEFAIRHLGKMDPAEIRAYFLYKKKRPAMGAVVEEVDDRWIIFPWEVPRSEGEVYSALSKGYGGVKRVFGRIR